ncbi:NAD(P)H-dependent oxidoreductase [Sansalvadorimonas sp. 2012CJ34-2]|uniref:NAD(P)H-dependent oxidoreductase n=1 Tax=Parendozoicomonas callyspongiae TaxID=2942213 RepID=A0ABT0PBF4_9GAMM|nr:NAD(P)H-dependent oxidoreductase [Sansalvadorimonas sp. 2012CJ34-2]MCL6268700.1 NAD(P)H-dependent oxidoreductase [Sansalvadorimonas sp. 2012CJ34-2]
MSANIRQQVLDAFAFRHACKSFDTEKKISEDEFNFVLEAGRLSPSSFGFEPWKFVVVQNPEMREKLKTVTWGAQGQLPTASHFVMILARKEADMHFGADYIQQHMREVTMLPEEIVEMKAGFYKQFQTADFNLTESPRAMFDWSCKQTYIALGNMMSVAAQIGIDSCPIEGFDREALEVMMAEEGLYDSSRFGVSCMVAFGYRENEPFPKTRHAQQDIVQWVN